MKTRNHPIIWIGIVFLAICIIYPIYTQTVFHAGNTSPVLLGDVEDVDAISLYAFNVWFPDGEFQKKEVTDRTNIETIVNELLSVRYLDHTFPPDDLGGGWSMNVCLHYQNGDEESYEILFGGDQRVPIHPPSGRSRYGVWPNGETLWERVDVPAEIISGDEWP